MPDQLSNDLASLRLDRDTPSSGRASGILRTTLLLLLLLGALGAAAVFAWPRIEARLFATEVEIGSIVTISPAQSQTELTAAGHVIARTLAHVAAASIGRVTRVHVMEGQTVAEGDLLVELDPRDHASALASARARVAAAQARTEQARAAHAEAELQLARSRALVDHGAAPRSSMEDLEARVAVLHGAVSVASADVRTAQAELQALLVDDADLRITAPLAGVVITDPVEIGEVVGPEIELMQIADFGSLVVQVDVPEARLGAVRVGAPCEIVLDAFPGERFRGDVLEIGRRVNRSTAAVPVRVRFAEAAENVVPDMSAHVGFLREQLSEEQLRAGERVVVPARAVVHRGGRDVVYAVEDRSVREQPVRLGQVSPEGAELLQGPEPGTRVVLDPPDTLVTGSSVREREQ